LIYAGAQKNMGPAGTTLIVVKKKFLVKQVGIQVCWITKHIKAEVCTTVFPFTHHY
jgi:phosphoserine aminotransferase